MPESDLPARGVAAHRGGAATRPENTLAAFREAARLGVHQIELDVRRCGSGEIVVVHDADVGRTTDGEGTVAELSLARIQALDAGRHFDPAFEGERIPTLDEALDAMPRNLWINVQIKLGEPIAEPVTRRVMEHGRVHQVILACGNAAGREARATCPEIRICALSRKQTRARYVEHAATLRASFVQFHHLRGAPSARDVALARGRGLRVNYFCDPSRALGAGELAALYRAGVDFPLVDDLEAALAVSDAQGIPRVAPEAPTPGRCPPPG